MDGVTGGIEQLAGLFGIVIVGRHVTVVSPALRRKNAAGGLRFAAPEIFDHRRAVEGIRNRLTHANIAQDGITQIESHVGEDGAGRAFNGEGGITLQGEHRVGRKRVDGSVAAAFA